MDNQGTIITVVVYNILLIGIGFLASKKNQTNDDFYLGNRGLGPWVAALSASASSSSAWTLLGVSGLAYSVGLGAVWILPGVLFGYFVSWTWIAPKLMELSKKTGAVSLPQLLFHDFDEKDKKLLMRLSTIIITSTLVLYVAAQFQAFQHKLLLGCFLLVFLLHPMPDLLLKIRLLPLATLREE